MDYQELLSIVLRIDLAFTRFAKTGFCQELQVLSQDMFGQITNVRMWHADLPTVYNDVTCQHDEVVELIRVNYFESLLYKQCISLEKPCALLLQLNSAAHFSI